MNNATNISRIFQTARKNVKNLCDFVKNCIFAASNIRRGGMFRLYATGFFIACTLQIHGVTPVGNHNGTPASSVLDNGSVTPFFCYHNKQKFSKMSNTETNCLSRSASSSNTSAHETCKTFNYEGNAIKYMVNGSVMISATQMAKPFGKSKIPAHWLNLQSTNEFITELSKLRKINLTDLVQVKYGGINPGTWFHEDVAIEYARWLSPRFGIWCNDRIKEILLEMVNGGSYYRHAVYPGSMTPTNCVVLTCHTHNGLSKQVYLMWGDDEWFRCPKWNGDQEIQMQKMMHEIGEYDRDVASYQTHAFLLRDGRCVPSPLMYQLHEKSPNNEKTVAECRYAIENYLKAKEEMKRSAETMMEYLNIKT